MPKALTENQKATLKIEEPKLRSACRAGDLKAAEDIIKRIQTAFLEDRSHFRILRAKNWYYESMLDSGLNEDAEIGFKTIRKRANEGTRTYLEATSFYGICLLRNGRLDEAKKIIRYVVSNISDVRSDERRRQYQRRLIRRIEDECILSQLIGVQQGEMVISEIHLKSIEAVKRSDDEIFEMIGAALPVHTQKILKGVTDYSIKLLPQQDQKFLKGPTEEQPNRELGKRALVALKRIGWKTFCDEHSEVYKLWSRRIPKVFNQGYFASSAVTSLANWKIGIPQLAVGIAATAMKYSCQEFCKNFKPEGLMIPTNEKG